MYKKRTVGAIIFVEKMFEYLFSSVDGRCMTHDAQRTITLLKILGV